MVSAVCRSLLAALLSAALLSGPSVAAAQETLTPGQVLQKLFPRVEPKKPRKTATARKPADQKTQDRAAAGEAAAPAPTAPIPEPKPKQSMATAAATA
ncbi:MAG: hypothetical protein J0H54_11540, partial [Rhizobiales bacterium]|nr:hypothetical protein [Hyphomicrobiales bacterium]